MYIQCSLHCSLTNYDLVFCCLYYIKKHITIQTFNPVQTYQGGGEGLGGGRVGGGGGGGG